MVVKIHLIYHLLVHLNHENQYKLYCDMFLFWFLYISYYSLLKNAVQYFANLQSWTKQFYAFLIAYHHLNQKNEFIYLFSVFIFAFILKSFNISIHLCNIKTNGLITSYKCSIKYLELFFVSINFEIAILSTLIFLIFIVFFLHKILLLLLLFHQTSTILYYQKIYYYFLAN